MTTTESATTGVLPFASTGLEFKTEDGKTFTMRRMRAGDVFSLTRILRTLMMQGGADLMSRFINVDPTDMETTRAMILVGLGHAEKEILDWLGDVLQIGPDKIRSEDDFPLPCLVDAVEAVVKHPDIVAFFFRMKATGEEARSRFFKMVSDSSST